MKYSDIVDRPAYKAPDKCPICGDWPFNGYAPDIKTTEDGETVFVWRCRRCSYNYVVPGKKVSQKTEHLKSIFIKLFWEDLAWTFLWFVMTSICIFASGVLGLLLFNSIFS